MIRPDPLDNRDTAPDVVQEALHDRVVIPTQRSTPADHQATGNRDAAFRDADGFDEWRYHYRRRRGADIAFIGHVILVGGDDGERLLGELGAVIRDLLEWAYTQQQSQADTHDQDGDAA